RLPGLGIHLWQPRHGLSGHGRSRLGALRRTRVRRDGRYASAAVLPGALVCAAVRRASAATRPERTARLGAAWLAAGRCDDPTGKHAANVGRDAAGLVEAGVWLGRDCLTPSARLPARFATGACYVASPVRRL